MTSSLPVAAQDFQKDLYENNLLRWDNFVSQNKWGGSEDYWLEMETAWGWERVALVMGYWNDIEACWEMKGLWEAKYAGANYRCVPANDR